MFDRLSEGFGKTFRKLSGRGAITEANVREAMQEVRDSLLEADVHYDLVNRFCDDVVRDALGQEVTQSLKPGQQMVGIVHRRLVEMLGGDPDAEPGEHGKAQPPGVMRVSPGPTIVMMCGLQGSGKTTTCGKLAAYLKKRGRSVMLVAADLQRPAAVEQLETVASQVEKDAPGGAQVHFYSEPDKVAEYGQAHGVAVKVCQRAVKEAKKQGIDTVILDTAGRLHVNDELMGELQQVNSLLSPHQIFLVVDAMIGQDAVNSAKAFHQRLEIDGVILTKFDSDTRGGAALSVKEVTGATIRFVGTGEKIDALEEFHPERVAGRVLGMGDVVSLVERAQEEVTEEDARKLEEKMAKGELTMDDFLSQMKTLRRMGPMKQLLGLLPGMGSALKDVDIDEKQLDRVEAIVNSMTRDERTKPSIITQSRRKRIARGSGTTADQVGQLVKQFGALNKMTKQMSGMGMRQKMGAMREMSESGMGDMMGMPGGLPGLGGRGPTKRAGVKSRAKRRKPKKRR